MKIDPTLKVSAPGTVPDERPRTLKPSTGGQQQRESVELSPLATQLQSIAGQADGDAVNASRVAQVKLALAEGRYQVNAEAIADRLIENARVAMRGEK